MKEESYNINLLPDEVQEIVLEDNTTKVVDGYINSLVSFGAPAAPPSPRAPPADSGTPSPSQKKQKSKNKSKKKQKQKKGNKVSKIKKKGTPPKTTKC